MLLPKGFVPLARFGTQEKHAQLSRRVSGLTVLKGSFARGALRVLIRVSALTLTHAGRGYWRVVGWR